MSKDPLSLERAIAIASEAIEFFGLGQGQHRALQILERTDDPDGWRTQFSVSDFITYLTRTGWEGASAWRSQVDQLLRAMAQEEVLVATAATRSRRPVFATRYVAWDGLTRGQRGGNLWMTPFLGAPLLVHSLRPSIIHLIGHDARGDERGGTGLALSSSHILTAKHVVDDMTLTDTVKSHAHPTSAAAVTITDVIRHPLYDLAVVVTSERDGLTPPLGLVSRESTWSDVLYVLGFPPVPTSAAAELIVQRGEVVNPGITTYHGADLLLYSAVARPGNSGGPIIGADGRLRGMVTQELVLDTHHVPQPFYAGLPTRVIHKCLTDLRLAHLLTEETWT